MELKDFSCVCTHVLTVHTKIQTVAEACSLPKWPQCTLSTPYLKCLGPKIQIGAFWIQEYLHRIYDLASLIGKSEIQNAPKFKSFWANTQIFRFQIIRLQMFSLYPYPKSLPFDTYHYTLIFPILGLQIDGIMHYVFFYACFLFQYYVSEICNLVPFVI